MTPAQINAAIAGWMGWTEISTAFHVGINPKTGQPRPIPNYHSDLNACAEFELKIGRVNGDAYFSSLSWIFYRDYKDNGHRMLISATAPQRCEALLRALNLWKE